MSTVLEQGSIDRNNMKFNINFLLTAFAPIIWGSTYYITTEFLPDGYPITIAMLRALPAGLLLWLLNRQIPSGYWWGRLLVLGALNFSLFWLLLFIAAYRLPGGVAATLGSIQPLLVIFMAYLLLQNPIHYQSVFAAIGGIVGVALLVLSPAITLDGIGIFAGLGCAASMALGSVLTKKWQPPVSLLTFTAWQLIAGGLLLLPLAVIFESDFPLPTTRHLMGLLWIGLPGAAISYMLWFRGLRQLPVLAVSFLGFLSPVTAIILGWLLLGQTLSLWQWLGVGIIIGSIRLGQRTA